jgi:hypothetical protein
MLTLPYVIKAVSWGLVSHSTLCVNMYWESEHILSLFLLFPTNTLFKTKKTLEFFIKILNDALLNVNWVCFNILGHSTDFLTLDCVLYHKGNEEMKDQCLSSKGDLDNWLLIRLYLSLFFKETWVHNCYLFPLPLTQSMLRIE